MNNEFVSVVNVGTLTLVTTILKLDGTTKTIKIHEGEFIEDLTYLENGSLHTVTGVVKVIKYGVKSNWTSDPHMHKVPEYKPSLCVHETVPDFSDKVIPTHLIMDCSNKYISDIRLIPVDAIRDFPSIDLGEDLLVENIIVQNCKTVTFTSNSTPLVAVWNNTSYIPKQLDQGVDVYTITVDTMKNINELVVIDNQNRFETMVYGDSPVKVSYTELQESYNTAINNIVSNYYGKYVNQTNVSIEDTAYYIPVLTNVGDACKVSFGSTEFVKNEPVTVEIGGNSSFNKDAFLIKENTLYIAAPLLYTVTRITGGSYITINGFHVGIETDILPESLTLESASLYNGLPDYTNTVELDTTEDIPVINLTREDGTAAAGWLLMENDLPIAKDTVIISKLDYSDDTATKYVMSLAMGEETMTDATYNYYSSLPITEPSNITIYNKVFIPGKGRITFHIKVTETVHVPVTQDPEI